MWSENRISERPVNDGNPFAVAFRTSSETLGGPAVSTDKSNAAEIWSKACKHLRTVLHPDVYSRWIAVIEPAEMVDSTLVLSVDNDFYQTWLEDNYLPLIRSALGSVSDTDVKIEFRVTPHRAKAPEDKPDTKRKSPFRRGSRPPAKPTLNPKFTFDEFIVGPSNNFAHAASLAVAQAPARAYNPLFIYGGVGLGKTHIMQAIGHYVLGRARANVCYLSSEAFLNEYIDHLQNRTLVQFRKKYRHTDVLLIDDIHFLAKKERMQEEFFHTFNVLFDAHKQIVMTSDRPANEITGLEQRLVSRFEWGLVTELEPPDVETRIAILRHKQTQMQSSLPEDLVTFIAENVRSNIRRLEGCLIRAISYASLTGQELSLETLKHLLRDTLDTERQSNVSLEGIQRAVAEHFDIRLADMASKRRPRAIAVPRQVAMFLCRRLTRSSLPDIANAFGKTHATVIHACRAVEGRLDVESDLRQHVRQISTKLGHPVL